MDMVALIADHRECQVFKRKWGQASELGSLHLFFVLHAFLELRICIRSCLQ